VFAQDSFPVSPDGRKIALIDLGSFGAAGHEAPQIFLLDLRSGRRCQPTHQSEVTSLGDPHGICCGRFLNQPSRHLPHADRWAGVQGQEARSSRRSRSAGSGWGPRRSLDLEVRG